MPTKQEVMANAPANWRITSNDGTTIVAVNIITGEVFSGTHAAFNFKTQMAYNSISTPSDLARHNDMHLGLGTPRTIWASGAVFWLPAGDGSTNGVYTLSGGGSFTIPLAVVSTFITPGWIYLPANAGGAGYPAGWYWFTMSDETNGKIYTASYNSTSGVPPVIPINPVEMAFTTNGRLTSTTNEIQMLQVPINYSQQLGINGSIEILESMYGNVLSNTKNLRTRAGAYQLHELSPTTSPNSEALVIITAAGTLAKQLVTRWAASVGNVGSATISNNFRAANLAVESTLNFSLRVATLTDHAFGVVRKVTATYGG